jgi:hypothetical protein
MKALLATCAVSALTLAAPAWAQPYPPQGYPQDADPAADQPYPADTDYSAAPYDQDQDMVPYDQDEADAYGPGDEDFGPEASAPSEPSEQYGYGPDSGDLGAPQYAPYENTPPSPQPSYSAPPPPPPQAMAPMPPQYAPDVPRDILRREARLERRIQRGGERGLVPAFHVDNLMVQLDSIRAQQDELAHRDGGLNPTDRAFIESRLGRLEANVTW